MISNNTPGRNEPCLCGSGLKYKKCCLMKAEQERNRIMLTEAKQGKPTQEQAIKIMHGYTQSRVLQHNGTVQTLHNLITCLRELPKSEQRDYIITDFERRLNDLTGVGMGREAHVTKALCELMSKYPNPESQEVANMTSEETTDVNANKAESETEEKNVVAPTLSTEPSKEDDELDAAVAGELEGDVQSEITGDASDDELDEIIDEDDDDLV